MCGEKVRGTPTQARANLRQQMPLGKKTKLALRNYSRRFWPRLSDCCGHPGEPGC